MQGILYLPRQNGGRGFVSVENTATLRLECYLRQTDERLVAAA